MAETAEAAEGIGTGFVSDPRMAGHCNMWDAHHVEQPDRLSRPLAKLKQNHILERCVQLPAQTATIKELENVHDREYLEQLAATAKLSDAELEAVSSRYEDIYFNRQTFDLVMLSAGSAKAACRAVLENRVQNSFALIRPPGHHASKDRACGFCFVNNVVVCAKMAVDEYKLDRVLILDWDVHAPQGTQYLIQNDPRILCVSMHLYSDGEAWPNLPECNWDYPDNTLNIPLNESGMGDSAYLFTFHHVIVPLILEFNPQLLLISAGYDAALGDPIGEMRLTPAAYAHMTHCLMALAGGRICALFEGGYFIDSVELDVLFTMKTLLGDNLPLVRVAREPPAALVKVLLQMLHKHRKKFLCFRQLLRTLERVGDRKGEPLFTPLPVAPFKGTRDLKIPYQLAGLYPARHVEEIAQLRSVLQQFMNTYEQRPVQLPIWTNNEAALWDHARHMAFDPDLNIHDSIRALTNDRARLVLLKSNDGFRFGDFRDDIPFWKKKLMLFSIGDVAAVDAQICRDCQAVGFCTGTNSSFENEKKRFTLQLRHNCTEGEVFYAFQHVLLPIMYECCPELLIIHITGTVAHERVLRVLPYMMHRCNALAAGRLLITVNPAIDDDVILLTTKALAHDRPTFNDFKLDEVGEDLHDMIADCWIKTRDQFACFHFVERSYETEIRDAHYKPTYKPIPQPNQIP